MLPLEQFTDIILTFTNIKSSRKDCPVKKCPYLNEAPEKKSKKEFSQCPNVEVSQTAAITCHHSTGTS